MNWNAEILPRLPATYRKAMGYNLVGQGVAILLGAITLDGGVMGATALIACVAYWLGVLVILVRRYSRLGGYDLMFFRLGFLVIWLVVAFVGPVVAYR